MFYHCCFVCSTNKSSLESHRHGLPQIIQHVASHNDCCPAVTLQKYLCSLTTGLVHYFLLIQLSTPEKYKSLVWCLHFYHSTLDGPLRSIWACNAIYPPDDIDFSFLGTFNVTPPHVKMCIRKRKGIC